MKRFDAVIFDWGDTIVDYPLRTAPQQIAFLRNFLLDNAGWLEQYLRDDIAARFRDQDWLEAFNNERDSFVVRPFVERMRSLLRDPMEASPVVHLERRLCSDIFAASRVVEGAPELLAAARRAGLRVGILSNTPWGTSPAYWRDHVAGHTFARDACDAVIFCGDVGYRKPHRSTFQHSADRLGVSPEKTVMVGNSLTSDVIGAQQCGLSAVWLNRDGALNLVGHLAAERLEQVAEILGF
jgi:FMN phosphatase YigB (HAD superfamily)